MTTGGDEGLASGLEEVLAPVLGGPTSIRDLARLAGGSSYETWGFLAAPPGGPPRRLVLRRGAPGAGRLGTDLVREARVLAAAREAGAPVPDVVLAGELPDGGGSPFLVMEHIEGETIAPRILRDDRFAHARSVLVGQCARALAAVHGIPLDAAGPLPGGDQLALLSSLYRGMGDPHPAFDLAARWLGRHPPPPVTDRVVHGDFRLGNLIVGDEGLRAVLDWELVHAGDPVEDLGWMCVRAWRFGSDQPVAGLAPYAELVDAYERASGREVEPDRLAWWQAAGTLRWGVVCLLQASRHGSGVQRSVEFAAIGRRVCEVEWDLLDLMGAAPAPLPRVDGDGGFGGWAPHDPPGVADLLETAAAFLRTEAGPALAGRTAFHTRVAANVAAMAAREIRMGPALEAAHAERLRRLGVGSEAALCDSIRAGDFDDREGQLLAAVRATVAAKLAVANPRYAGEKDAGG
ncbi:MAG TPA: phosphotransferase family protein [Acidimicrobiales bacterium]|nr:phosphotransferase family protein [Acidimicrobiales bacterium]